MTVECYSDNTRKSFRTTSYPWQSMRRWNPGNQKRQMSEFVLVSVPFVTTKVDQDDTVRRAFSFSMIEEQYPSEAWTHVYTDGSAINVDAGIQILFPRSETITASVSTGKYCSNYRAETEAILYRPLSDIFSRDVPSFTDRQTDRRTTCAIT